MNISEINKKKIFLFGAALLRIERNQSACVGSAKDLDLCILLEEEEFKIFKKCLIKNFNEKKIIFLENNNSVHILFTEYSYYIVFEHGMCACVGGLDRAHVHIMSVNKNTSETILKSSIEKVLQKRKLGINYVKYRNHKLFNIHNIDHFINNPLSIEGKDYEINGKILKLNDIRNLNFDEWPHVTLNHINKGGHYVYFRSDSNNASFLTNQDFKTQFGREVIFENELVLCKKFQNEIKYLKEKYPLLEFWKWQNWMFENKVIETVNGSRQYLNDYKSVFSSEYEQYHLEII